MRKLHSVTLFFAACVFLLVSSIYAQDKAKNDPIIFTKEREIENKAFTVGEKLTFDINYGYINAGTATMSIPRVINYKGREVFEVRSRALSNRVVSAFYPVDDKITTYIDKKGIFSWRLEKHLNEGKHKRDMLFLFDQENNLAFTSKDTTSIPEYCQDILSAFYYARTQKLVIGETIVIPNFDNSKVFTLEVEVIKKQKIRVPAGTFDTIVVQPRLQGQEFFKHEGTIRIYLSDDERKIPVQMTSKVIFGEVAAKLTKIENEVLDK